MEPIPDDFLDLFERRTISHVATLLPDDTPHVVPTWVDYDGGYVLVNTFRTSRKEKNVRRRPEIALSMTDPDNAYRFLAVRGAVIEITEEGAIDHVNALAKRYAGVEEYPRLGQDPGPRVILRIRPGHVTTQLPPTGRGPE